MVINLTRYRGVLICIVVLIVVACLAVGKSTHDKQSGEKTTPSSDKKAGECGVYMAWGEVNRLFPRYAKATITDFETKKSFRVQRRAGSSHADVQPLTAEDTALMKEIYQGKWSWKRRSVVVTLESGTRIAASMAGMPHGQGAIRGNRFNGHFCLDFRNSTTHGSGKIDLPHQMMIWKSAGILENQLAAMKTQQLVRTFFTSLAQGDKVIAGLTVSSSQQPKLMKDMDSIVSVRLNSIETLSDRSFRVILRVQYQGSQSFCPKDGQIDLIPSRKKGWLVDYSSVQPWLRQPQP